MPVHAQETELVSDFNAGPDDSAPITVLSAVYPDGALLLAVGEGAPDPDTVFSRNDEMIYLLSDGVPSAVAQTEEIVTGVFVAGGTGYFAAEDRLYRVAGDRSAAEVVPGIETDGYFYRGNMRYVASADGASVYFSYGDTLYEASADAVTPVRLPGGRVLEANIFGDAAADYADGVAFATEVRDTLWVYGLDGAEASVIASVPDYGSFRGVEAVYALPGGLLILVDEQPLAYREATGVIDTLLVDGESRELTQTGDAGAFGVLGFAPREGFFLVRDLDGTAEQLLDAPEGGSYFDAAPLNVAAGSGALTFTYQDRDAFQDYLVVSDGTAAGTERVREIGPFPRRVLTSGDRAYLAEGTVNGFDPKIIAVDLASGVASTLATFTPNSQSFTPAVQLVDVQEEYLYFWTPEDASVGNELYRVETAVTTGTEGLGAVVPFSVAVVGQTAVVRHEASLPATVRVVDAAGRTVAQLRGSTNVAITLPAVRGGHGYLVAEVEGLRSTVGYPIFGFRD